MSITRFLISTLAAAGFGQHGGAEGQNAIFTPTSPDTDPRLATRLYSQDHLFTLAGHRSHSSHSSHSSHRSGYSGGHYSHTSHRSGMSSYSYTPAYVAPVVPAPAKAPQPHRSSGSRLASPAKPSSSHRNASGNKGNPPALTGRSQRFAEIVRKVQMALYAQGFYRGAIDGIVGPSTRDALRLYQKVSGLEVTGTITPETLDALRISTQ